MNPKRLIPFAVILAVLVIAIVILKGNGPEMKMSEEAQMRVIIPQTVRPATVRKIEIERQADEKIILLNKKGQWQVASLYDVPVDLPKLERVIGQLSGIMGEERSSRAELLADYELNDNQALKLRIFVNDTEKPEISLLIGKNLDYRNSFVRKDRENTVYLVNANLRQLLGVSDEKDFSKNQNGWADKQAIKAQRDLVAKVVVKSPGVKWTLVKEAETSKPKEGQEKTSRKEAGKVKWKLNGKEVPLNNLDRLLDSLNSFRASQILDPGRERELGLEQPTHYFELVTENGETRSFSAVKDKEKKHYYLKTPAVNAIYQVNEAPFNNVFKSEKQLLEAIK